MRGRFLLVLLAAWTLQLAGGALPAGATTAWTTYRHDGARSGIDPDSTNPIVPSQAWQLALDGEVYGQPLVYGSYVYVATENDTIYKLVAATGAVVWARHLATPEPQSAAPCHGDISPIIGITSTPVIDPSANRIYAVGAVSTAGGGVEHHLFALDLASGQPVSGFPIGVDPPYPAGGLPANQLQRAALALDGGRVLVGFGGNDGDCGTYWGWLVSAPANGAGDLSSFQADAGHDEGAIWGSGNAPTVDASGNVFVATGNGTSSADPEYGDSVIKLNAAATPLDWWAPTNWQTLDATDRDLGSSAPTLLPGGYLFQSGKDGNGYLLNSAHLGMVSAPVAEAQGFCAGGSFGGSVYDPANATIYAACHGGLQALSFSAGPPATLTAKPGFSAPSDSTGPPIIAADQVWVTDYLSGTLYGLDLASGAVRNQLHLPEQASGGYVNHFSTPSAGGGRLFVASGNQVTAFTIALPPSSPPVTGGAGQGPVITHASLSKRRFRVRRGAMLRLTLSEAATLTVAITQLRRGHLANHRCSLHRRHGKACLARVTVRRLRFRLAAGPAARKLFTLLPVGHYTAFVSATDHAGRHSRTIAFSFAVLAAPH